MVPYRQDNLFHFKYNLDTKIVEQENRLAETYGLEKIYENMPYSFVRANVYEEDQQAYIDIYKRIERGERFATCDFRVKSSKTWSRVCLYRESMDSPMVEGVVQDVSEHYDYIIAQTEERDQEKSRRIGLEVEASQLMRAISATYEMIISVNLTKNSYHMISYERYLNQTAAIEGVFDDLITVGINSVPDAYKESFRNAFSRQALLKAYAEGEKDVYLNHQQYDDRGEIHWVSTHVLFTENPYNDDILEITLSQNIDERIRKETESQLILKDALLLAERANDAKSDFLSRMSHDIRTPMNAIIGMTAIAKEQIDDRERVEDCLCKINNSSRFLLGLVNDILDLSKIEGGRMDINNEIFAMHDMLQGIVDSTTVLAAQKQQKFNFVMDEGVLKYYVGDCLRVEQILLNLLSNAHKFTAELGEFSLRVKVLEQVSQRAVLEFVIEDSGLGISENLLQKIFEPFMQVQDKSTRKGSGLGLAIVQNLVHLMNGSVRVHSKIGEGSRFIVELPFDIPEQEKLSEKQMGMNSWDSDATASTARGKREFLGENILLVEDNEFNQEVAQTILEMHNLTVDVAADGYEAIRKFEASRPGHYLAIFMDIQMPGMDGYETTQRIRKSGHEDGKSIPIFAMTADAFATDVSEARQHGMNGHFAKPVDFDKVVTMLSELLPSVKENPSR